MTREAPAWLEAMQARFTSVIRTPLDRSKGVLAVSSDRYDARAVEEARPGPSASGVERLAVYNRQYWFRLFEVLQGAFPLTCRLLGHWSFNGYASRYLIACPPHGWDIDRVGDAFEGWLAEDLETEAARDPDERLALREASRIDAAFSAVFRAPAAAPFRPSPEDAARLLDLRLVPSPAVAIVEEHRALLALRRRVLHETSERRVPLPPAMVARSIAIVRTPEGTAEIPLDPREAELHALLRDRSIRDALGELERRCSPEERDALPAKTQGWLARAVELGFWVAL